MGEAAILTRKQAGAYFTPGDLAATLVSWLRPGRDERMLDPACGDGAFLVQHGNSVGIERDAASVQEAIRRAPCTVVHEGDFFTWAAATGERFACAAGNPPFIRYQSFAGEVRKSALAFCATQGADFSGLASSWAPFLVATAALLEPGGRMAFVVPAEIGHAPYAAPLLEYLVSSFARVQFVAVRRKVFPDLSEDTWLLVTEGKGGRADAIHLTVQDTFAPTTAVPAATVMVDVREWRELWDRRLRPYLVEARVRQAYGELLRAPDTYRFGDFAAVGIGYVSGANSFFHLRPSEAARLRIPREVLQPTVRNARALPSSAITQETVAEWLQADEPALLLRLRKGDVLDGSVSAYLDSEVGRQVRHGYKCRTRSPWYVVPDVQVPDYVMSYMSGRAVSLARNLAGVTCSNTLHAVRVRDHRKAARALPLWGSPWVRLSCELSGHALGGGLLKLEPREAGRVIFPGLYHDVRVPLEDVEGAIATLQAWRHYGA